MELTLDQAIEKVAYHSAIAWVDTMMTRKYAVHGYDLREASQVIALLFKEDVDYVRDRIKELEQHHIEALMRFHKV